MVNLVFANQSHKRTTLFVLVIFYRYLLGLTVCTQPEKNSLHSSDGQGAVVCECPPGMNGDGRKDGSGYQKHFPLAVLALQILL
jgi:hypothetical protein